MFDSILSVLGAASSATGLHSWFTSLKTGEQLDSLLSNVKQLNGRVEKLTDHLFYTPDVTQVYVGDTGWAGKYDSLLNRQEISEMLSPVQGELNCNLLTTNILSTPDKLREYFTRDPWEVLIDIRPISRTKRPSNPDMKPVFFCDNNQNFVGWQLVGALNTMLGCTYSPNVVKIDQSKHDIEELHDYKNNEYEVSCKISRQAMHGEWIVYEYPVFLPGIFMRSRATLYITNYRIIFSPEKNAKKSFELSFDQISKSKFTYSNTKNFDMRIVTGGYKSHIIGTDEWSFIFSLIHQAIEINHPSLVVNLGIMPGFFLSKNESIKFEAEISIVKFPFNRKCFCIITTERFLILGSQKEIIYSVDFSDILATKFSVRKFEFFLTIYMEPPNTKAFGLAMEPHTWGLITFFLGMHRAEYGNVYEFNS